MQDNGSTDAAAGGIDRRGVLGTIVGGTALAALTTGGAAGATPAAAAGAITLEEHFYFPGGAEVTARPLVSDARWAQVIAKLTDVTEQRLVEMDANGIAMQIVSLTANGVQGEPDKAKAADLAKAANDWVVARFMNPHPTRFGGFAAVPLQDPAAAAREVERAVTKLGFSGVLINGFVNVADRNTGEYLDHPMFTPFWDAVSALGVPVYLHPRDPLPSQRRMYEGLPEMLGAIWAFNVETAGHALRLVTSGLFDRYPRQQLILGHMGEGLIPVMVRSERKFATTPRAQALHRSLTAYIRENVHITTSGFFHTPALQGVIAEMGIDRVMFSIDYPFENMALATKWLAETPLSPADRAKLARANARRLLKLR